MANQPTTAEDALHKETDRHAEVSPDTVPPRCPMSKTVLSYFINDFLLNIELK